jgi:sialate O-acetylesterase
MRKFMVAVALAVTSATSAFADVKLHPLFSDRGVLQRGRAIPVWGTADAGAEVMVSFRQAKATGKADESGCWKVELPAQSAGGPDDLTVSAAGKTVTIKDVLVGEVWICSGQSNMEWTLRKSTDHETHIAAAGYPNIRLFFVPLRAEGSPQTSVNGNWKECTPETAANFSAVAYFFGRDLHKKLDVPIGLIQTTWGGTPAQAWTSDEALKAEPSLKHYSDGMAKRLAAYDPVIAKATYEAAVEKHKEAAAKAKDEGNQPPPAPKLATDPGRVVNPGTLYNAMIAPLIPYGIAGAIWYQGESNGSQGFEYRTLFATMIKDWRTRWGQGDFAFLCVQLAPYNAGNTEGPQWAEVREAQFLATKTLPNVGMAVITDVGEKNDIHPPKKEPVGIRLALLARRIAYGENVVADGPVCKSARVEGNRIVLSFDSVGAGLEAKGGDLKGFTICGNDNNFIPAKAEIRDDTVVVWSESVEAPVAVRYGWKNWPEVNLFNKNGLTATPFRTDSLPLMSQPKK